MSKQSPAPKQSPLPFKREESISDGYVVVSGIGGYVCSGATEVDAKYICLACNSHGQMLAALHAVLKDTHNFAVPWMAQVLSAVSKAEGQS